MLTIYHNPRCRKSREGLQVLEASGKAFETRLYLSEPFTRSELTELIKALDIAPIDLVRKGEAIWKSEYKGKDLNDSAVIDAMLSHPKLIERPVVTDGTSAVIGRPAERIRAFVEEI